MPSITNFFAGLDIGGTKLAAGLVSAEEGRVLKSIEAPTLAREGGLSVLRRSLELVGQLLDEAGRAGFRPPAGLGIASAGQIDPLSGRVISATGLLPGWAGVNLKLAFEERFGLPCQVDNDVNGLAVGELCFGQGRGYADILYGAAGTGLGGALLRDGQLWRGAHFSAGELGHSLFIAGGRECECGRRGCLEQYTASRAVLGFYRELAGAAAAIEPDLTIREISLRAARDPEGPAGEAFKRAGRNLGAGLAALARVVDPQVIILGGGLVAAVPLYLAGAQAAFAEEVWPAQRAIPLLPAGRGAEAGLVGAASLCMANNSPSLSGLPDMPPRQ